MLTVLAVLRPRLRLPPLAFKNVLYGGARTLTAVAGIGFAVTMVLLQLGFLQAVKITAVSLFDELDFDVALVDPRYDQLYDAGSIPIERLRQAEGLETVVAARPLWALFASWRCPGYPLNRPDSQVDVSVGPIQRLVAGNDWPRPWQRRELLAIGVDLDDHPFAPPIADRIARHAPLLREHGRFLMSELSNPEFGWTVRDRFNGWEIGDRRMKAHVVGGYPLAKGFGADASVLCNESTFARATRWPTNRRVQFGLLKVAPGTAEATVDRLRARLPEDVVPMTRDVLIAREIDRWVYSTSTGKIFSFGVLIAAIVAAVVVGQVLSTDVREHLPEYATLKAMGHSNGYLARVVMAQALIYAVAGYIPAILLGILLYRITNALAGIPMKLTAENLLISIALTLAVGLFAGLTSLNKVRSADPAELF